MKPPAKPITDQEIAEVIDLIDKLLNDADTANQGLALCRTVTTLVNTPKLSLHGIWRLIEKQVASDHEQAATALIEIAGNFTDERWIQFRCGHHLGEIGLIEEAIASRR